VKPYDVVIVGAGIAGASLAAELAAHASVAIVEAEAHPGYHATGRSAAFWSETYGGPKVQPLTTASGPWLANPPSAFADTSFLTKRGEMHVARAEDQPLVESFLEAFGNGSVQIERLTRREIDMSCDFFRPEWDRALSVPSCAEIDVAALHQAYLRMAKRDGAALFCHSPLSSAHYRNGRWCIEAGAMSLTARILVNASGAWADDVAVIAGTRPVGITPYRRTILQVQLDRDVPKAIPLILDIKGGFYFKSDGHTGLWLSPHDETMSPAIDVAPDELDVAQAIDRFEAACTATVKTVRRKWAGLRSFAPDRLPVFGFDTAQPGFFWFAGQGGFGIQTAPAAAKLAASSILGTTPEAMIAGIDADRYAPSRFT
jgi:D-arginine dehydrogenase